MAATTYILSHRWFAAWLLSLALIPILSVFGRPLQRLAREHLDPLLPADVSPDMVRRVNEALANDPLRRRLAAG